MLSRTQSRTGCFATCAALSIRRAVASSKSMVKLLIRTKIPVRPLLSNVLLRALYFAVCELSKSGPLRNAKSAYTLWSSASPGFGCRVQFRMGGFKGLIKGLLTFLAASVCGLLRATNFFSNTSCSTENRWYDSRSVSPGGFLERGNITQILHRCNADN
jgi:hypothetical protein